MTFNRAVQRYRDRAGDSFTWPDHSQSIERGERWYLRDARGRSVAIVDKSGHVLCNGTKLTTTGNQIGA